MRCQCMSRGLQLIKVVQGVRRPVRHRHRRAQSRGALCPSARSSTYGM
eukprot:CAMPEP_0119386004 /NCGR_PEP_ID=MMETSP1334-20130426/93912_1 /TAXON_ID=127549 /ORGANISM="Calcidiscus leptoporus, Strain RCC1130" /LENGTH=47 /DNA_ID= /DNA_START= /DNA_END= /DNA_ORIENTATION=